MVDLNNVPSFQKIAVAEQAVERVSTVNPEDQMALFSVCLPDAAGPITLSAQLDQDRKGLAFTSSNPNLRVLGFTGRSVDENMFFGFAVGFGTQFVQIAEYERRWFVRDG